MRKMLAAICCFLVLFIPAPAQAHGHDTRPCVSLAEVRGVKLNPAITLHEVEERWDIKKRYVVTNLDNPDGYGVYQYKACGYHMGDVMVYLITQPLDRVKAPNHKVRNAIVLTVERLRFIDVGANGHNRLQLTLPS